MKPVGTRWPALRVRMRTVNCRPSAAGSWVSDSSRQSREHGRQPTGQEDVAGECLRVTLDASSSWRDVGQLARGTHVATLASAAQSTVGAGEPFRIRTVGVNAEDDSFMAGSAEQAFRLQRQMTVGSHIDVIQRTEKHLPLLGPQQLDSETAVCHSDGVGSDPLHLVTEVAMDALACHTLDLSEITDCQLFQRDGRCVTRRADSRRLWVFRQQSPALVGLALPVRAIVQVQESRVRRRTSMCVLSPFVMDGAMTVAAIVLGLFVRCRTNPGVQFAIAFGQRLQCQIVWLSRRSVVRQRHTANEEPFFAGRDGQRECGVLRTAECEAAFDVGCRGLGSSLDAHSAPATGLS